MAQRPPETIHTQRLSLRLPRPDDLADIFEYASDPEVTSLMDWSRLTEPAQVDGFLARTEESWGKGTEYTWVITEREVDRVIGAIAVRPRPTDADFGYVLNRKVWGRGFAAEASAPVIAWLTSHLHTPRVWATCDVENHRSARVLEKLGMVREGVLARSTVRPNLSHEPRDSYRYVLGEGAATAGAKPA